MKRSMFIERWTTLTGGLLMMLTALVAFAPTGAKAQHVCGSGPGADEVQVGVDPASNAPVCNWTNSGNSQQQRNVATAADLMTAANLPRGWTALVVDRQKYVVSNVYGYKSKSDAVAAGIADCNSKGGTNCTLMSAVKNGR